MHYMIIVYSPTYLHKLYMTCSRYTFNHLLSNNIRNLCQTMHIKRKKSTNNSFCPIRTEHKFNYISNVAEKNHYIRILMVKCTRKARRSVAPQQHFISCDVAQYPSLFNSPHSWTKLLVSSIKFALNEAPICLLGTRKHTYILRSMLSGGHITK